MLPIGFLMKLFAAVLMAGLMIGIMVLGADDENALPDTLSYSACDPGQALSANERARLFAQLAKTAMGRSILADFVRQYGSYRNLLIQWDSVSYSQVVSAKSSVASSNDRSTRELGATRSPASEPSGLGDLVCIHLTRKLPDIEHLADLAHELAHATRLRPEILRGDVPTVEEFVKARLTARGGEADAFAAECQVKNEILGRWDALCSPYASSARTFDTARVVKDLYDGRLSASLTGETYPVMLARQFKAMLAKRVRLKYLNDPYARK